MDAQALFTALKTKYPQSGLSDKELLGIATSLFATGLVTDENVNAIVDKQGDSVKGLQSLFDSRFSSQKDSLAKTLKEQAEKDFKTKYKIGDDGKQIVEKAPETEDEKLKALVSGLLDEKLKPISDRFKQEDTKQKEAERTQQILAAAKAHGIKEEVAKLLNVPSDVTDVDSYVKDMAQTLTNAGLAPATPPHEGGGGNQDSDGKAIAEMIKAGAPKPKK